MEIRLPKLGEGAESGTVVGIFVKEGDSVARGQTILELENEKAVAPIPSPAAGKVAKLRVKEGDKLSVGQVILVLGEEEAAAPPKNEAKAAPKKAKVPPPKPSQEEPAEAETPEAESEAEAEAGGPDGDEALPDQPPPAPPAVRKVARELGIDLRRVRGSERGGRVVMGDLRGYIQRLERLAAQAKAAPKTGPAKAAATVESIDFSQWGPVVKKPLTALRQTISQRLSLSWNTIPHVTQFDEADITALNNLRKRHAAAYEAKGARLTVTSFVLQAVVATLKKHPIFNSSVDEAAHQLVSKDYWHLGLAVDTEQGLVVPVIRNADQQNLLQLSVTVNELAEKARARKLTREEMQGGTFTISNQGGIGGAHFTPIINKPEVAILGLGRGALKPVIQDGGRIEPRLMMPLALSYDHRVIDGGSAARFMVDLVQALQSFKEADATAALR